MEKLIGDFLQNNIDWITQIFIIIFITVIINAIQSLSLKKIEKTLQKTENFWDNSFVWALSKPLSALIWIIGLAFAIEIIYQSTQAPIFSGIEPLRDIGVISSFAWFLIRFINKTSEHYKQKNLDKDETTTITAVAKLLRISVFITAALIILQTLGFSISGLLAFGGVGGLAVGLAAKDMLANFFGSLVIYLDRPFKIGDWIRSPDKEIEGTVESIGWRMTMIRTFDQRPLYIPNAVFTSISVENPSRMSNRRIYETIGLRYEDSRQVDTILADIETMLRNHEAIDQTKTMMVNFNKFNASSLDFFIYTFTKTTVWTEFHKIKQEILLKVIAIIHQHGADIAYPTQTIHLNQEPTK